MFKINREFRYVSIGQSTFIVFLSAFQLNNWIVITRTGPLFSARIAITESTTANAKNLFQPFPGIRRHNLNWILSIYNSVIIRAVTTAWNRYCGGLSNKDIKKRLQPLSAFLKLL